MKKIEWLVPALGREVGCVEESGDPRIETWIKAGMVRLVGKKGKQEPAAPVEDQE